MKKTIKTLISLFIVLIMLVSAFSFNVFAARTVISFSKKTLNVGDTVNVSVTLDAGEAMYGVECVVNYDSNVLEYKSGTATGGAGSLKIVESPSGEKKVTYTLTFAAKKAGSATVSVADCFYAGLSADKGISGASAALTVKDVTLSGNANLKSLIPTSGKLSPAFSPSITTYEIEVKNSVTECRISATAADSAAKVEVTGSPKLEIGKNTRNVVVTAPNGTQKTYIVNITRSETDDEIIEETPTETEPLEVAVEGVTLTIISDLSVVKLFNGFSISEIDFKDTKISVAVDENNEYKIYYLKSADSEELVPYTYDEKNDIFEKLNYYTQGEKTYIFADIPSDKTIPEAFYTTNTRISDFDVKCYASSNSNMSDFYYLYCYSDGKYGFYRYDSRENVLQRYPELELLDIKPSVEKRPDNIVGRFKTLTPNAKIIVIALLFVIVAAIALCVILIIRICLARRENEFEDSIITDEDFENITFNSNNDNDLILEDE